MRDELTKAQQYLPADKLPLIQEAYQFAAAAHNGQTRLSGEPFIEHPVQTALYLADLRLDADTLAAALLHDVIEDCGVSYQELESRFGPEVARLVDGVTKLSQIELRESSEDGHPSGDITGHAASLRKMLVSMAQDIRVILIKLADRLHNLRTLRALPELRRTAIARETLEIYTPLAHRLGIWEIKWRLEDTAFRHLDPAEYRRISRMLASKREEREAYIQQVAQVLEAELKKAGVQAQVTGRPKHIYSIYTKMQKYAAEGKELGQIYDLYALRVIVKEVQDCYAALGVVHSLWRPLPGQFDDYIANPKENLYQSLHTAVMCVGQVPLEVQIRTQAMHRLAEYGVAAHWRYKEGDTGDTRFEENMTWLRQLLEWQREVSGAEEFLETVKTDVFHDQVFVYTPKGEIKELPAGATPLDFAYLIHTDLGHRCVGGKVNGKLVSLDTLLQNGDTVEVLVSKVARGPSLDWLNPNLGYVHTAHAREKIRQWFRRQERSVSLERGREILQKELRRLNTTLTEEEIAHLLRFDNLSELLVALGDGSLTTAQIAERLTEQQKPQVDYPVSIPIRGPTAGVQVLGVGDLLTRMAQCCNPVPGDPIVGFITRNRGVTVHRADCPNLHAEDEQERLITVDWGRTQTLYPVRVVIEAWDRVGLLRDVSSLLSAEKVNIASVVTTEDADGTSSLRLTLFVTGIDQLSRVFSKLEGVRGVISVGRTAPGEGRPVTNPNAS